MRNVFLFLSLLFLIPLNSFSYEVKVHRSITKHAISASNMNQYLSNNIGISPLNDKFNDKLAWQWIEDGSDWEDDGTRWLNHFYDPINNGRGLTVGGITLGEPSLQWGKSSSANVFSWAKARRSYYDALTDTRPGVRNLYFSYVFKDLGQVLHLVQDLSVPAHVRNDAHPYYFETILQQERDMYEKYTRDNALNYSGYPAVDFNSFDKFWVNGGVGLAEYTNKNFFSESTISNIYPDPAIDKTNYSDFGLFPVSVITTPGNVTHNTFYVKGYGKEHLAALKYFGEEILSKYTSLYIPLPIKTFKFALFLDDRCHKDYADFLIPRAVGYSAGLLNYFFRGQMEATGIETKSLTGSTGITVDVKNTTPNEDMSGGTFVLSYRYKAVGSMEYTYGKSNAVASGTLAYNAEIPYQHIFYFDNAIPVDARDKQYILVFYGTLGNEEGAVVGKIVNLEAWENWEKGLTGRHPWLIDYTYYPSDPNYFTVVNGIWENNKSKVLKISIPRGFLKTGLQPSIPAPKKVSFDYLANSFVSGKGAFLIYLIGGTSGTDTCIVGIDNSNYIYNSIQESCNAMEIGKWVHFESEGTFNCSQHMSKINSVQMGVSSGDLNQPAEIYIDNIKFEY